MSLGSYDNSNVVCAITPACWKEGNGTSDIIESGSPAGTVSFPLYLGPSAFDDHNLVFWQYMSYLSSNGTLTPTDKSGSSDKGLMVLNNISYSGINDTTDLTIEYWGEFNYDLPLGINDGLKLMDFPESYVGTNNYLTFLIRAFSGGSVTDLRTSHAASTTSFPRTDTTNFTPSGLQHFVLVKDGTDIKLYVNGVESSYDRNDAWSGTYLPSPDTADIDLWFAYNDLYPSIGNSLYSAIIHDKALSASEVSSNYSLGYNLDGTIGISNDSNTEMYLCNLDISTVLGNAPLSTQFTIETNGTVATAEWNFGDGNTSTEINPTHIYTQPGTFDISVTFTLSEATDSATITKNDAIEISPGSLYPYITNKSFTLGLLTE